MIFLTEAHERNRLAYIVFGDDATIKFNFTKYTKLDDMLDEVKKTPNENGLTAIGKALNVTLAELLPTMHSSSNKLVIMMTDGQNNVFPSPYVYADLLKDANVQIIAIGIGREINKDELIRIASPGSVFSYISFSELVNHQKTINSQLCPIRDPIPNNMCEVHVLDLVILLDSSGSISEKDFQQEKDFVKNVIQRIDLGVNKTRIALMSFSDETRLDVDFEMTDRNAMLAKLESLVLIGSTTGIGLAFRETTKSLLPKRRPDIPFNVILLTDGFNNIFPQPEPEAKALKDNGANIITVGIGSSINIQELNTISSQTRMLTVDSYDGLMKGLKTLLKTITCEE